MYYRNWKRPLVMHSVQDNMTGLVICISDDVRIVCSSVIVALQVEPVDQAVGAAEQQVIHQGKVLG